MATMDELKSLYLEDLEQEEKIEKEELQEQEEFELEIMSLEKHRGWQAVVKELKKEKKGVEDELFDIFNKLSDLEIREKRIRRYYLDYLINLPKTKRELFNSRRQEDSELI